jgi:hypothetical protein
MFGVPAAHVYPKREEPPHCYGYSAAVESVEPCHADKSNKQAKEKTWFGRAEVSQKENQHIRDTGRLTRLDDTTNQFAERRH